MTRRMHTLSTATTAASAAGSIRVQNRLQLAALLMRQPIDTITQGIARGLVTGNATRNNLPIPVPVFVVYQTARAWTPIGR